MRSEEEIAMGVAAMICIYAWWLDIFWGSRR